MFEFTYELTGPGWSQAIVVDEKHVLTMRVSYLSDALRDLTLATTAIVGGIRHITCRWQDEPGGVSWELTIVNDLLDIAIKEGIYTVTDMEGNLMWRFPAGEPATLFETTCTVEHFAHQVLHQLWQMLNTYGMERYKQKWRGHEFPLEEYKALKRAIKDRAMSHNRTSEANQ